MRKLIRTLRSSMAANVIGAIILLLVICGLLVSSIGMASFATAFKNEYATSTYHMADTATALINGDHLEDYLDGLESEEYEKTRSNLDIYCKKMSVSLIYVILVDRSDYGRFVSVFNSVDNSVDNSSYVPWELGHKRDTTNDEYRERYRALYEKESCFETIYRTHPTDGQHPHITTLVPVTKSSGEVAAILCMQRPMSELEEASRPFVQKIAFSTILLSIIAVAFAAVFFKRQVVEPVKIASDEASRFARENTKGKPIGKISKYEEIARLATSIDTMETDMVNYMEHLTTLTADKQRISTELSLATQIQATMMPHIYPAFPDRTEFDIYALMHPAKEVGGDFYDFFLIDEDHLCMVMADVSGKGIPAALFMMASKIILQSCAMLGQSAAEILTKTNEAICSNNQAGMFITVWLGILEISSGKLTAANAGHEYPVIKRADGAFEVMKDKHGLVIGALEGVRYREYELQFEPGMKLFLYTDGVPEASDAENRMFGLPRMLSALNADKDAGPEKLLNHVLDAMGDFVKDAEQFDDTTMLCLEYRGKET
ncbi:MAG: serine/threonine-protein phosphatase [Oscillospiraceae bacterium]|nr:serine/threonine-protein phosphatase [Oscillospiraceae bacterium]